MREVVRYLDGGDSTSPSPPPSVCFDDFVHSYPSSSFEKAVAAIDGGTQTSVAMFLYSPLSMRSSHISV